VGIVSASAPAVYSVNAVGFVNLEFKPGFTLMSNPLDNKTSNKVGELFKGVPEGFTVYKFDPATGYAINGFELGEWANPNMELIPGEAAFVLVPTGAAAVKVTFVGEVKQGNLSHAVKKGLTLQSSEVPQAGVLDTDLKFPVAEGDLVYRFMRSNTGGNPAGYSIHSYELGEWGVVPNIEVGEGFWVNKLADANWTRTFNVNQ
jgi:hypothetical protein